MSERAPYSRVYWSVVDDPKFVAIYDDDRHLATWLRLLIVADQAHPASAPLPYGCRKASIAALVESGLVDLGTGNRYRIHGLDAERERRRTAATRDPRGTQPGPKGDPEGPGTTGLSQAEPSQDETSLAETPREDPADGYWSLTGRYPKDAALSWIDRLTATYGAASTMAALVKAFTEDKSANTLLGRTENLLRSEARKLDRAEKDAEEARLREKRSQPRVEESWKSEFRDAIQRQYEALA